MGQCSATCAVMASKVENTAPATNNRLPAMISLHFLFDAAYVDLFLLLGEGGLALSMSRLMQSSVMR